MNTNPHLVASLLLAHAKQASPFAAPEVASSWSRSVGKPPEAPEQLSPTYRAAFTQKGPGADTTLRHPTGRPVNNRPASDRWLQQADRMVKGRHVFSLNPSYKQGPSYERTGTNIPYIYGTRHAGDEFQFNSFRDPMRSDAREQSLNTRQDVLASRDFIERTQELPAAASYEIKGGESPRVEYWPLIGPHMYLNPAADSPYPTATHEYEHLLSGAGEGRYTSENPFTAERLRHFYHETPSVLAETVAQMRSQNRLNPGSTAGLAFGDPEYNKATGEFIRQQGSRYMYGRDPFTDQKLAPQRTMTDLLTTTEGRQWLDRMGKKPISPPSQPWQLPGIAKAWLKNVPRMLGHKPAATPLTSNQSYRAAQP